MFRQFFVLVGLLCGLFSVQDLNGQVSAHPDRVYPIPNNYGSVNEGGINLFTGDLNFTTNLASITGKHVTYNLSAFYNSRSGWYNQENPTKVVSNALGGWGWKLMDYPKVVRNGSTYYLLDGTLAHELVVVTSGSPASTYETGKDYYLWKLVYNSTDDVWDLTNSSGVVHELGNKGTVDGYDVWHLSQIYDPNWQDSLYFYYSGNQLQSITNLMDDSLRLHYNASSRLDTLKIFHGDGAPGADPLLKDKVILSYNSGSQYGGQPLLTGIDNAHRLLNNVFTDPSTGYQFEYYAVGTDAAYMMHYLNRPSAAIQAYRYESDAPLDGVVIRYAVDNGYLTIKDDGESNSDSIYSAVLYDQENYLTDPSGFFFQFNTVMVYPGGLYEAPTGGASAPAEPEDPYGHLVYYLFNGQSESNLNSLPEGYHVLDYSNSGLLGKAYRHETIERTESSNPGELVASEDIIWDIFQPDPTPLVNVVERIYTQDSVDYSVFYTFGTAYTLPATISSTLRNPGRFPGAEMEFDSLRTSIRYAFQDHPAMETLRLLEPVNQMTSEVRNAGSDNWEIISSIATQWDNNWTGGVSGWGEKAVYFLDDSIGQADLSGGLAANPDPAFWHRKELIQSRDVSGNILEIFNEDTLLHSTSFDTVFNLYEIAQFSHASLELDEADYYGFELYEPSSKWAFSNGKVNFKDAHTGAYSIAPRGGGSLRLAHRGFSSREPGLRYIVSAYVKVLSGGSGQIGFATSGGSNWQSASFSPLPGDAAWQYVAFTGVPNTNLVPSIQCSNCLIDDLRFMPVDADFSAMVYYDRNTGQKGVQDSILDLDFNRVVANLETNGSVLRWLYDAFDNPIGGTDPTGDMLTLRQTYASSWGNEDFNSVPEFDPDYPNMVLSVTARDGGSWTDFRYPTDSLFPSRNRTRMYLRNGMLQSKPSVSASNPSSALLKPALSGDYGFYAEILPGLPGSGEEVGFQLGGGSGLKIVANASGMRMYGGGVDTLVSMHTLPPVVGLTVVILDDVHCYAYLNGRFLFKTLLASPVGSSIAFFSSHADAAFDQFAYFREPLVAKGAYDALSNPKQILATLEPTEIYASELLYGFDLNVPVARTRDTYLSHSEGLAFIDDYADVQLNPGQEAVVSSSSLVSQAYEGDDQPFSSSTLIEDNTLMRTSSSGTGGNFGAGDEEAPSYDYSDNEANGFGFEDSEMHQYSDAYPYTPAEDTRSNSYTGLESGLVFGVSSRNGIDDSAIRQQATYDGRMLPETNYLPNFFDRSSPGADQFIAFSDHDFRGNVSTHSTPDHSTWLYGYDRSQRVRLKLDPNGVASANPYFLYFRYDQQNRIVEEGLLSDADINQTITASSLSSAPNPQVAGELSLEATTVNPGAPFSLRAGRAIFLNPGTEIPSGATMKASIQTDILNDLFKDDLEDRSWPGSYLTVVNSYSYDEGVFGVGNLTGLSSSQGSNQVVDSYSYDLDGNIVALDEAITIGSDPVRNCKLNYDFNEIGDLLSISLDASSSIASIGDYQVTYAYDPLGRVTAVGRPGDPDYFASYDYNNGFLVESLCHHGSGPIVRTYSTTAESWVDSVSDPFFEEALFYSTRANGQAGYSSGMVASMAYSFSGAGSPADYNYELYYDPFGRLASANPSIGSLDEIDEVVYDPDGNPISLSRNGTDLNPVYAKGSNQLVDLSGGTVAYDANGNVVQADYLSVSSMGYDPFFNQPNAITRSGESLSFLYDAAGQRKWKHGSDSSIFYFHGQNSRPLIELVQPVSGSAYVLVYVYGPTGLIALQRYVGGTLEAELFFLKDHLSSIRVAVDSSNSALSWLNYDPTGNLASSSSISKVAPIHYRFTNQEFDSETGLYNFHYRFYDPVSSRFLAPDPAHQQASGYTYAGNNPVTFSDPSGGWFGLDDLVASAVGAVVGAVAEVVTEAVSGDGLSLAKIGVAAAAGAVSGEVGLYAGPVAAGGVYGAVDQLGNNLVDGKSGWDVLDGVGESAAVGALTAGVMEGAGKLIGKGVNAAAEELSETTVGKAVKNIFKKGCGCFEAGTPVKTADGYVPIEALSPGDSVWSRDVSSGVVALKPVVGHQSFWRSVTYSVFVGGEEVVVSPEHLFYHGSSWLPVYQLVPGDTLYSQSGNARVVDSVSVDTEGSVVYILEVADFHSFYVSDWDLLVHNGRCYWKTVNGKQYQDFADFWNNSSKSDFNQVWNCPAGRESIKRALRQASGVRNGGGYHEWYMVAFADQFKSWQVSFEELVDDFSSPIKKVTGIQKRGMPKSNLGRHGGKYSGSMHSDIKKVVRVSKSMKSWKRNMKYVFNGGKIRKGYSTTLWPPGKLAKLAKGFK